MEIGDLADGGTTAQAEVVLQRLVTAQRIHALYPRRNPKVLAAVGQLIEALAVFPSPRLPQFDVAREHLLHEDLPLLAEVKEVRELARKLYLASISSVILQPDASEEEILGFLDLLRLSDDERRDLGSLGDELRRRGVNRVQVRELGHATIAARDGSDDPWDLTSLEELEALEMTILGDGQSDGFHESFRTAAEGEDPKAGRLLGLLARPAEFATLLLDTASQHRSEGRVDLDAQLAFLLDLISRLEPMLDKIPANDATRLYGRLEEVVTTLERGMVRELLDVSVPPYVRLAAPMALFPDRLRSMTVKEALGLGLGPGLMPLLMSSLRHIAAGETNLLDFLGGVEEAERGPRPGEYRPAPLPAAPPSPPRLMAPFFEVTGVGQHPGERALATSLEAADAVFDSIETLKDLLATETDIAAFTALVEQLAARFRRCLETRTYTLATQVLHGLYGEWNRRSESGGETAEEFIAALQAGYDRCGSPETMRAYLDALAGLGEGAPIEPAAEPLLGLTATAVGSLLDLLAAEHDEARRARLLQILTIVGRQHVDTVATYGSHPDANVAHAVAALLGRWGPEFIPQLLQIAAHPDARVRKEVVRALCEQRCDESAQGLSRFVHDDDDTVVREVIKHLVELDERSCLPALHEELQSARLANRHPATVAALVRALGSLGDDSSKALLTSVLKSRAKEPWLASSARLQKLFEETAAAIGKPPTPGGA